MIAAAVVGVRQALDYRSLARAIAVCAGGAAWRWVWWAPRMILSENVS